MTNRILLLSAALSAILSSVAAAQGTKADYERSANLERQWRGKVFGDKVEAHWLPGGDGFWYRNVLPGGKRAFVHVDAVRGTRSPAFDHAKLAAALGTAFGR